MRRYLPACLPASTCPLPAPHPLPNQSLVLLDEVGSGTDPAEGAALAAALLERLQTSAALTYATTHHAELKVGCAVTMVMRLCALPWQCEAWSAALELQSLPDQPGPPPCLPCPQELAASAPGFVNASVEFDVASLRPTYRLQWGAAGESNALAVAQGLGFSPEVVAAARQVGAAGEQCREGAAGAGLRLVHLQMSLCNCTAVP